MRHSPLAVLALLTILAAPALATNPDGPVGSMALSFTYGTLGTWNANYTALGQSFTAGELGYLDRGGSSIDLFARVPVSSFITLQGGYSRNGWSSLDEATDDVGTFTIDSDGANHWFTFGARFYIPFTSKARESLKAGH